MSDEVLTVGEVAKYLKLDERTVYNLAQQGKLPAIKVGKQWRFRKADIDRLFGRSAHEQGLEACLRLVGQMRECCTSGSSGSKQSASCARRPGLPLRHLFQQAPVVHIILKWYSRLHTAVGDRHIAPLGQ